MVEGISNIMEVGNANIKGDVDFNATVDGVSQGGSFQDLTTSIASGATFDLEIALGKGGFTWGMAIFMKSAPPVDGNNGYTVFFTASSSEAHSMGSRISYTKYYSKLISSAFLSGDDFGGEILLQDAYIDNANENLVFTFYNKYVSSGTLTVQGTYGVHQ